MHDWAILATSFAAILSTKGFLEHIGLAEKLCSILQILGALNNFDLHSFIVDKILDNLKCIL
jgi:hypothetical protein